MIDNTHKNSEINRNPAENHLSNETSSDMDFSQMEEIEASELFAEPIESENNVQTSSSGDTTSSTKALDEIETELSALRHAVQHLSESDGVQKGSLDEIEAELLALRQAVESIDNSTPEQKIEAKYEHTQYEHTQPETPSEPEMIEPTVEVSPEPQELDSYAALAAELFEQSDSKDYGVNSQNFNPEQYDTASETDAISPMQIDEEELEIIDAADLEALLGLHDAESHNLNYENSFLADAARVEAEDSFFTEDTDDSFQLDEIQDEITIRQPENLHSTETEFTLDDEPYVPEDTDHFSLDDLDDLDENSNITEKTSDKIEDNSSAKPKTESVGLDLQDDGDDPLAWLNKIKNEMSNKFDIDIGVPAKSPKQEENLSKINEVEELTEEVSFDDVHDLIETPPAITQDAELFNLDNLDDVQTEFTNINHTVQAAAELVEDVDLYDILIDDSTENAPVNLTAEPINDTELEVFDESSLTTSPNADVLLDLSGESDLFEDESTASLSQTEQIEAIDSENNLSFNESNFAENSLPEETDSMVAARPETNDENIEENIFEQEIDFAEEIIDLPEESLEEVSISVSDMEELDLISEQITQMEELDLSDSLTIDEAVELSESIDLNNHSWAQDMVNAIKDKAEELEMRAEIVAHDVVDAVKQSGEWAENMGDAISDKMEELEMRAEIVAHDVMDSVRLIEPTDSLTLAEEISADELDALLAGEDLDMQHESVSEDIDDLIDEQLTHFKPAKLQTTLDNNQLKVEVNTSSRKMQPESGFNLTNNVVNGELVETATVATVAAMTPEQIESDKLGWTARLKQGLTKSRNQMAKSLAGVFGGGKIDEDLYEELETTLLISDMGIEATEQLMNEVRKRVSLKGLKDGNELRTTLKDALYELLKPLEKPLQIPNNGQPFVIMMAGINGAGKTTSIGKLAKYFQAQGKSVMLAAGDTFRAAAREQLQEWGARNGVTVISQASGDSAAVCFDAVESAKAKKIDVVLADTAGRLPTQLHLMEEIKKVKRVLQKSMPDAPHEVMVVLDANIGQNAINQVVAFDDALGVTGLIVTKLDGTAKGGVLAALASNRPIPVRYIGVGEGIDDLRPFDARAFVDALLDE